MAQLFDRPAQLLWIAARLFDEAAQSLLIAARLLKLLAQVWYIAAQNARVAKEEEAVWRERSMVRVWMFF